MKEGQKLPSVNFQVRVRDESIGGDNPFRWQTFSTEDYFSNKRVVVFSLPGAYTPTCSTYQLPGFEDNYWTIRKDLGKDVDEIYVMSVNDTFVMRKWLIDQHVKNVKFIPDGNGEFTDAMGMLIDMTAVGFGNRSRRYAFVADNGVIEKMFVEPEPTEDNPDPYGETSPENVMKYLTSVLD